MGIYKEKCKEWTAQQFLIGQALPPGVQVNALSSTGYSYDTLENVYEPDDAFQIPAIKGFEVSDRDYLIYENGRVTRMSETDFNNKFEVV